MIFKKPFHLNVSLLMIFCGLFSISCTSISVKTVHGIPSQELWYPEKSYDRGSVPFLVQKENEDFTILLFSDIQLESSPKDRRSLRLVDQLVKEIQPDLILTTGDNTSWRYADKRALKLIRQMESYNIPWGVTLGNHDSEGRSDRIWLGNQYENAKNSLFRSGPSNIDGIGNYSINIQDEEGNPVYTLIMMDSNEGRDYGENFAYDFIHYNQIEWYEWLINGITTTEKKVIPSMLFFHIPLQEFEKAYQALENNRIDKSTAFGEIRESISASPVNTGFFGRALALKSTTHIFCGHDHRNNLSVDWKGIRLTYGLKTGPTCYSDPNMNGATLITIEAGSNEVLVKHIYLY